ncbi:MAG: anhydro-N-acetylmuramic acid kinase [Planctomycetes bacterium]|nr:anhydro-N-acetylmuramic acid kinase [Planctomycetota bacterium]
MPHKTSTIKNRPFKVIGLMSGTSTDGISACLTEIHPPSPKDSRKVGARHAVPLRVEVLSHETYPYEPSLRDNILEIIHPPVGAYCNTPLQSLTERLAWMNILLGYRLAEAAKAIAKKASLPLDGVDLIGSHGHTFFHCPEPRPMGRGGTNLSTTLQLGEPSVIAHKTGVTTVADFRMADVAAGGSGAPLVPYVDYLLFQDPVKGIALQNIGGIANVTFLPPSGGRATPNRGLDNLIAFDTGPGNMVIDRIIWHITRGGQSFDEGGRLAQKGRVNERLLSQLMGHPFLQKPPPKSTGREEFGHSFADNLYSRTNPGDELSLLATVTAFTARSIAEGYKRFITPHHPLHEVFLYGGGVRNHTLVRFLKEYLPAVPVRSIEELGIPTQAKEPMSFAVLAYEALAGHPANVPSATGARDRVILGKIAPGRNWKDLI